MPLSIPKHLKVSISPEGAPTREIEVDIVDVTPMTTFPTPMTPRAMLAITYVRELMPPRVVWIPRDEYSPELLTSEIAKDIEASAAPPEEWVVP